MLQIPVCVFAAEEKIQKVDSFARLIKDPAGPNKSKNGEPQVVNFRTKNNQVTEFVEQETARAGYINGAYGADAVYLGSANGKFKFMLSGVVGWVRQEDVQVVNLSQAKAVSCYEVIEGRLMHHIVQDMTRASYATSLNNGPAPSYLVLGRTYYSYDGHYFYEDYGVMAADYRKDQRINSVNPDEPYYNYFQYLPMRSRSFYTGEELEKQIDGMIKKNSKMKHTGKSFVEKQDIYGVNALLMTGIAANESDWGRSEISIRKNNLFGLNAVDSSPGSSANAYESVAECVEEFARVWMSGRYLSPGNFRYHGGFLGNKSSGLNVKYASDPYWGEKTANIAWRLDQSMGGKDAGKYLLAVKEIIPKNHFEMQVRRESSASSIPLYRTGRTANYVVLVRNPIAEHGYYEVQSDAVLNAKRDQVVREEVYDFQNMYGYIRTEDLILLNPPKAPVPQEPEPEPEPVPQPETPKMFIALNVDAVELFAGESYSFGVKLENKTEENPLLVWKVEGNQSLDTKIDQMGSLTLGEDETADKMIVRVSVESYPEVTTYAIISRKKVAPPVVQEENLPEQQQQPQEEQQEESAKTGDETEICFWMILEVLSVGFLMIFLTKSENKK